MIFVYPHLSANEFKFDMVLGMEFQAFLALDSNVKLGQIKGEVGQTEEDDNPRMGALKFQLSLQKNVGETSTPMGRGLLYVDIGINQKPSKSTMVDFGVTHNFITEAEAR